MFANPLPSMTKIQHRFLQVTHMIAEALPVGMISRVTGLSIDEIKAISLN
jgi:hypothetical protein